MTDKYSIQESGDTMEKDLFSLHEKVVLITGGSGHLGAAMSEGVLKYGAKLYIASRNQKKNAEYVHYLSEKYNTEVFHIYLDTTDNSTVQKAVKEILLTEGKIDVLINNSYSGTSGDILSVTEDDWLKTFDGSIHSTYRLIKEVLPSMINRKSGSIINIASMYGVVSPNPEVYGNSGQNNPPHYGASKAAIIQFSKYLAGHYGKEGIRVNAISPGPFPNQTTQQNKEFIEELAKKNPLGRVGRPEELQGIVVLLASNAGSYITGQNISVDGGWTAW